MKNIFFMRTFTMYFSLKTKYPKGNLKNIQLKNITENDITFFFHRNLDV